MHARRPSCGRCSPPRRGATPAATALTRWVPPCACRGPSGSSRRFPPRGRGPSPGRALLVARIQFLADRSLPDAALASTRRLLGAAAAQARSLPEFVGALPRDARLAFAGVDRPDDLWRAEARWWSRVESDAAALLRRPRFGPEPVIGTVVTAAVDAWRVIAALECAARGGRALEDFDAVA